MQGFCKPQNLVRFRNRAPNFIITKTPQIPEDDFARKVTNGQCYNYKYMNTYF
jgi:hypothetical protein